MHPPDYITDVPLYVSPQTAFVTTPLLIFLAFYVITFRAVLQNSSRGAVFSLQHFQLFDRVSLLTC